MSNTNQNSPATQTPQQQRTPSLQGLIASSDDERALLAALEKAFDYRGDVTITCTNCEPVSGYIFDRSFGDALASSTLRILPANSDQKLTIRCDEIQRIEFTGKDAAHGKSWETWIKRFIEKKRAGEPAGIDAEPLD